MHYGMGVLVYAHDEEGARKQAEEVMGYLSCKGCGRSFDYYTITGLDAKPAIMKASSKKGQETIAILMKLTKSTFMEHLAKLRKGLATLSDEEIYLQRNPALDADVRYHAHEVGLYKGCDIFLHDNDGEGIREPGHLTDALEKWPTLTDKSTRARLDSAGEAWVVTIDAHS